MELNTQTIIIVLVAGVVVLYLINTNAIQLGGGASGAPFFQQNFGHSTSKMYEGDVYPPKSQCGGNPHGVACKFLYNGSQSDRDCIGYNDYPLDHAYGTTVDPSGYKINY